MVIVVFFFAVIGMGLVFSDRNTSYVKVKEESSFPIVFIKYDKENLYNVMHGYAGDINSATISKGVTIVKSDRNIQIHINDDLDVINKLEYSLYDIVMGVEIDYQNISGKVVESDDSKQVEILFEDNVPFVEGRQYELRILATVGSTVATYYTDIIYSNYNYVDDHIDFAKNFNQKTFDDKYKEELEWYLESKRGYKWNKDYSRVTIYDPIAAIMWEDVLIDKIYDPVPVVKQMSEDVTVLELRYLVKVQNKYAKYYDVVESYNIRTYNDTIYLNSFERELEPRFAIGDIDTTEKKINLGIGIDDEVEGVTSTNGKYFVFSVSSQLWLYNLAEDTITTLYSQDLDEDNYYKSDYGSHGTTIFQVNDDGEVLYGIYGHINSGYYEGSNGLLIKKYSASSNENNIVMFIPMVDSYECIKLNGFNNRYMTSSGVLYFQYTDTVYSIDMSGRQYSIVVQGIDEHTSGFSQNKQYFAWQDNIDTRENKKLVVMDFESGLTREINTNDKERIKLIGFIRNDVAFGFIRETDIVTNLNLSETLPIRLLEIRDMENNSLLKYEKSGQNLLNPEITSNRIAFDLASVKFYKGTPISNSKNIIDIVGSDFILHSDPIVDVDSDVTTATNADGNIISYYTIKTNKTLASSIKKLIANEGSDNQGVMATTIKNSRSEEFYVYALGKLTSVHDRLSEAIDQAKMVNGKVLTQYGLVAWENVKISKSVSQLGEFVLINQHPELTLGCEVAALASILKYEGYDIDKVELANQLQKDPQKLERLSDREFFGNMNDGFVGDIYGRSRGHGVYYKPIQDLMSLYIARHRVLNLTGSNLDEILYYVDKGVPVWTIVTTTYGRANDSKKAQWMTKRGMFEYSLEEHAVVIIGYNSTQVTIADPDGGIITTKSREEFAAGMEAFGSQAIAYVKQN